MKSTDYQAPKLLFLSLEGKDVITTSGTEASLRNTFDKGVEDFFED